MSFDHSDLQRLKEAADIVDIVSSFCDVRRAGSSFTCRCPFHFDNKPSMSIDPRRQLWRCWVCDIGGDIFAFLMRSGMNFVESVQFLSDRTGIVAASTDIKAPKPVSRLPLYDAMSRVMATYSKLLPGSPAERYMLDRGITRGSIQMFGIGYAPESLGTLSKVLPVDQLVECGMCGRTAAGNAYELIRDRVVIPILDNHGRCVSLSGRVLPGSTDGRKYLNGKASAIFDKSRVLFGLNHSCVAIKASSQAVIVEGHLDVISLMQAGVANVAGVMGTSLTSHHLRLLTPIANTIILLLDGDKAGIEKSNRLLELFVESDVDVRVALLPDNLDPMEYLTAHGVDALRQVIASSRDAIDHRLRVAFSGIDPTTQPARAATAIDDIVPLLRLMHDCVRRDQVVAALARSCCVAVDSIASLVRKKQKTIDKSALLPQPATPKLTAREVTLFAAMMASEAALSFALEYIEPEELSDAGRSVYTLFCKVEALGNATPFNGLMTGCADSPQLQSLVISLTERQVDFAKAENIARGECDRMLKAAEERRIANLSLDDIIAAKRKSK